MAINEGTPNFPADAAVRYGLGLYLPDGNFYHFRGDNAKNLLTALSDATGHEVAVFDDSQSATLPVATAALRTAALLYALDGTSWRRLQTDASANLKTIINAALPAGGNTIGNVGVTGTLSLTQLAGDAVPSPALLGSHHLPVLSQPSGAYATATHAISAGGEQFLSFNFSGNTAESGAVFDFKEALLVIANAGTGVSVTAAALATTDNVGGINTSILYGLVNVSIANNAYQVFKVTLNKGVMASWVLDVALSASTTVGSIVGRLMLRSHTTEGAGDIFSGTVNPSTSAAALARSPADNYTGAKLNCRSVFVQNDPSSSGDVYVGATNQQTERLTAGAGRGYDVTDISQVWVKAISGSPRVNWTAEV